MIGLLLFVIVAAILIAALLGKMSWRDAIFALLAVVIAWVVVAYLSHRGLVY